MKIHLVDGTYELFRAFYGAPSRLDVKGREVGASRGLLASLLTLLNREGATHVAVAFDHVIESFRNELFEGYKTGEGIDPQLKAQFFLAEDVTRALGITCWPMVEFEADDALATAAHRFAQRAEVTQVVICSPDKDLMQCVEQDRIVTLDRRRKLTYNEVAVVEKMGIRPASIPDYLALVGDNADGIPGIPRWGAKSTATVLSHYPKLETIPQDPQLWEVSLRGQTTLAASLQEHMSDAQLYRTLATLRRDVPLDEDLEQLAWKGAHRPAIEQLAQTWNDPKIISRIPMWRQDI